MTNGRSKGIWFEKELLTTLEVFKPHALNIGCEEANVTQMVVHMAMEAAD